VARYRFENNGNSTSGSYALTATGTPQYSTSVKKEGSYSLKLDGASYLTCSNFPGNAAGITLSAWVYLDSSTTVIYPSAVDFHGTSLYWFSGEKKIYTSLENTQCDTGYEYTGGSWVYLTMTYDGSTVKLYVNSVFTLSTAMNLTIATSSTLYIGNYIFDTSSFWKGYIDDVQIYSRALSASEISTLYSSY
jgi:hypothetical protein